ncbi:universal stress protein [Microbacterium sp. RURRCA19A]|uniref:universal stress protein n=1 Tax=Microbacterium sp. RURRCA19A TaxID=1907391 RepID=UPI00095489EC|nr:universal stress protein [Microbacterium sp. RURRCA19A]SIR81304.1 Nucleotide-binding universal stress protein, UspA family [Microbacterium sp. RURRCA19A]
MERMVLGFDGSPASEVALEWAAERARGERVELAVVLVTNMFLSDRVEADRILDAAVHRWHSLAPDSPVDVVRLDGVMPATLTDSARGAGLLVLGIRPGSRRRSVLGGGMPLRAALRSGAPTVLVPEGWTAGDDPVVVGLDDDDSSQEAVHFAAAAASSAEVPLRVVHSWLMGGSHVQGTTAVQPSPHRVAAEHARILDAAVARVRADFPDLEVRPELVRDNPTSALTRAAARSSLVVIGSHGRGLVAGALLGSVGQDLVGSLERPIAVVPASTRGV